ncbi:MAG TPA: hypothetical protein VIV60_18315 [Polyangiaceae bacterium]
MALTRREFLFTVPLVAGVVLGCGAGNQQSSSAQPLVEIATSSPGAAEARTILVCMPETTQTKEVWKGLSDELSRDYKLVAVRVERSSDAPLIAEGIKRYRPDGLVLMNNPTVTAYQDLQKNTHALDFPPAVIVMTSFVERESNRLISATGISYEVPLITVMTNLRKLVQLKQERVGVVVRAPLREFVGKQVALAKREKVVVTQESVSPDPNPSEIKRAIRRLKESADVLWILNDDRLLTPKLLAEGWLPGLDERPWLPTIVGAGSLVSPERSFGTFAVLPDHVALGAQAASMIMDIADRGWTIEPGSSVQLPLSTTTTMDLSQVKERFAMQQDALQQVDRILE